MKSSWPKIDSESINPGHIEAPLSVTLKVTRIEREIEKHFIQHELVVTTTSYNSITTPKNYLTFSLD